MQVNKPFPEVGGSGRQFVFDKLSRPLAGLLPDLFKLLPNRPTRAGLGVEAEFNPRVFEQGLFQPLVKFAMSSLNSRTWRQTSAFDAQRASAFSWL